MASGTLSCSDLCSLVQGQFSAAVYRYTFQNSGECGATVQREQKRFIYWEVEFEENDDLDCYFRYDKPALVCIRMRLENLAEALSTLNKLSKKGIKGFWSKMNPFSKSEKAMIRGLVDDIVSENSMLQYLAGTAKQRAELAASLAKGAATEVKEVKGEQKDVVTDISKGFGGVMVKEVQPDEICAA